MGAQESKPDPVFREPWRTIDWSNKQAAFEGVSTYKPTEGQQLRILLHGPVGAGNDIMGLSETKSVLVDDVKLVFEGRVKDGYTFNPESKLSEGDQFYNKAPTDNDKVHVLVCVLPADTLPSMRDDTKRKIREIRLGASRLGIPQVAVLTKVDQACPEVKGDVKNVYKSKRLKERMQQFSADVGIPMNCVFPVKNYHEGLTRSDDADCLILSVLKNNLNSGDDFINVNN